MAVTRTLAELAADVRLGDGATDPTGPHGVILARIAGAARVLVEQYAPDAPDEISNEAFTRLAGYLMDHDPSGMMRGGPSPIRSSGAASLLAPWKVRRGGLID